MLRKKNIGLAVKNNGEGVVLTALMLTFSGILFSVEDKLAGAAPVYRNTSGNSTRVTGTSSSSSSLSRIPLKRPISEVSGNNGGPIPSKRTKVAMSSSTFKNLKSNSPDDWVIKSTEGGTEKLYLSVEQPKLLSDDPHINYNDTNVYGIVDSDGYRGVVTTSSKHSTGWHQLRDVDWVDITGNENKRPFSDVSGGKKTPIPTKRRKVELGGNIKNILETNDPETWILIDRSGGNETVHLSSETPIFWSTQGANSLYETYMSSGVKSIIRIEGENNTGWLQIRDVVYKGSN